MFFFNNMFLYIIYFNMISMSILSLFTSDLFLIWFLMEINNFMFISYLSIYLNNKKMIFFYFLIQIIASLLLILSFSLNNFFFMYYNMIYIYSIYFCLMIKLGIPPFHFWMPLFSMYANWDIMFILLTIQKIIPFNLLSLIKLNNMFLYMFTLLCATIPPLMMLNNTNFKKLLTYSSINQSSWMIFLIYMKNISWLIYFSFYIITLFILIYIISLNKMTYNFLINKMNFNFPILFILMMFNMSSLPPMMFFMLKWYSVFLFILNSKLFLIFIILMLNSLLMFYIYINMMLTSMFFYIFQSKMFNFYKNFFNLNSFFIPSIILFSPLILLI